MFLVILGYYEVLNTLLKCRLRTIRKYIRRPTKNKITDTLAPYQQNVKLFIRLPSDAPYTRQGKCFIRSIFPVLLLTSPVIPSPRHPFHEKAHFFSRRPADEPDFRFGQQPGEVTLPPYPDPDCHLRKKRRQHNRKANHGILHPRNEKRYPHLPYPGRQ